MIRPKVFQSMSLRKGLPMFVNMELEECNIFQVFIYIQ